MEANEVLRTLRESHGLTQEALAQRLHVTRQAISRWETGETVPNTETLKQLSREFDVSINTLLGSPRQLFCQCCGMPLQDGEISREPDGSMNEEYCKWCYQDGAFVYQTAEQVVEVCAGFLTEYHPELTPSQAKDLLRKQIPYLKHWANGAKAESV